MEAVIALHDGPVVFVGNKVFALVSALRMPNPNLLIDFCIYICIENKNSNEDVFVVI